MGKAKKELTKLDEVNKPLYSEREETRLSINFLEDLIQKMESALAEARNKVDALKNNLPSIDANLS